MRPNLSGVSRKETFTGAAQLMRLGCLVAALLGLPLALHAQMTVTGRVTAGDLPIQGATVSIRHLDISARTGVDGLYSFIIRASQVRGQTVTVTARHSRHGAQSVQITLTGGSIVRDFSLRGFEPAAVLASEAPQLRPFASRTVDSTTLGTLPGSPDLAAALAGLVPGLQVSGGTAGGSSLLMFRGPRSLVGPVQPLIVIDGVALDNASSNIASQQFGLGGFDYGTRLQDIAVDDIAAVTILHGASAAPLFGMRAANGVVSITTKQGGSRRGLDPVATLRVTDESVIRLPSYQNSYGQGLGGQFEFFDGQGGGINDAIDQNWGPRLDGQPIAQASLTEPRRPDVRHWLPHPAGFENFFQGGRVLDASVSLNATRQWASGRFSVNARNMTGVLPGSSSRRLGVSLSGVARPAPRLNARAALQVIDASAANRPGTGFDGVNPVAGFTRIGRQVDLDALRSPITAGTEQVNWIYTEHNNPFFQPLRNSNEDARTHVRGGGAIRYDIGRGISATLSAGAENSDEDRDVRVAAGWKGGYPTALGRRDFSRGGSERQTLAVAERTIGFSLASEARDRLGLRIGGSAGVEMRKATVRWAGAVVDTGAAASADSSEIDATAAYAVVSLSRQEKVFLDVGVRAERGSFFPSTLGSALFPSAGLGYDVLKDASALRSMGLGLARVRASWWEAGSELTPRVLQRVYASGGTATAPVLGIAADSTSVPERTRGLEFAGELASAGGRLALDLTAYTEKTREAMVATSFFTGQTAALSNRGIEAQLRARPIGPSIGGESAAGAEARGLGWLLSASLARNRNRVERVGPGVADVPLGPPHAGVWLVAREGAPSGTILGTRYLRDGASGAILLRNGLPIADDIGPVRLGSVHPDWTASLRNTFRLGALEAGFLIDARVGGRVFSATNLWGSYAGTLTSTLNGRETGLLIVGLDSVTRQANADSVSAEDYFHALAAIHEAWVFDATYWKLREARVSYALGLHVVPGLREHVLKVSIAARNLITGARAPNIDPEVVLSATAFQGFEMGQLPNTRSIGIHFSISP